MIYSLLYDPEEAKLHHGGSELIDVGDRSPSTTIWVVVDGEPENVEVELLSRRFGIHGLAITDALRDRHPPKIESFKDNTFILLKGLDAASKSLDFGTIQLSLFLGERFLVTRSSGTSLSTEAVRAQLIAGGIPPDPWGVGAPER